MTDLRNVPVADDIEWLQLKYAMNAAIPVSAPVILSDLMARLYNPNLNPTEPATPQAEPRQSTAHPGGS